MDFTQVVQSGSLKQVKYFLERLQSVPGAKLESLFSKAIITAVISNREDVLPLLLKNNCNVNQNNDTTPLHVAAGLENENIVKMLLDKGFSVTAVNESGETPLHIAVKSERKNIVKILLEKEASITAANKSGKTPLQIAFENEQMEIVDLILNHIEKSLDKLNSKNKQDLTQLLIAYARDNKTVKNSFLAAASKTIKILKGHSIHQHSHSSTSNLQSHKTEDKATKQVAPSVVNKSNSSEKQENPAEDSDSSSDIGLDVFNLSPIYCPLDYKYGYDRIGTAEFHVACGERHPNVIKRYLLGGWDVDARLKDLEWATYPENSTPLHCAVEERHDANVKVLLKYDANVMLKDKNGATPLHIALYRDDPKDKSKTLDLLYAATKNKKVNLIDKFGMSFLHVAASRNDLETVKRYLDQGENVNQTIDNEDYVSVSFFTPLHFAVRYRHLEMTELLISYGADPNIAANTTPLHIACEFGHLGIIELLLKNGATAESRGGKFKDQTALHLLLSHINNDDERANSGNCVENEAFKKDYKRKLELFNSCLGKLLAAGCDINAKDMLGNTALHLGCCLDDYYTISVQKLLWHGANINVVNRNQEFPLEMIDLDEHYNGSAEYFMKIYHHVQELKALGLPVHSKNEEWCEKLMEKREEWSESESWETNGKLFNDEELQARHKQRVGEVEKMKKVMLTREISLYDFVRIEPRRTDNITIENVKLKKIVNGTYMDTRYPVYLHRIRMHWNKLLIICQTEGMCKRKNRSDNSDDALDCKRLRV